LSEQAGREGSDAGQPMHLSNTM